MILLELFLAFLRVGCFSFGGAYAAIPLIRDVVLAHGWLTDEALASMIAVSESTPGPIMVNLATYVGSSQAGLAGAAAATAAVVLPSFVITLLVTRLLRALLKNSVFRAVLDGLTACVVGVILATGLSMTARAVLPAGVAGADMRMILLAAVLAAVLFGAKPLFGKTISPIALIAVSAVLGIVLGSL